MNEVVVVGSTNWDFAMHLPSLPLPGETVAGGRLASGLGGKGANQAVASHRAGGASTAFISCIGDDDISASVRQVFRDLDMAIPLVGSIANTGTGSACLFVDAKGENCIGIASGANACLTPEYVSAHLEVIEQASVVLLQLEIPMTTVQHIAARVRAVSGLFVLNPAPAQSLDDELLAQVDILTPNQIELSQISGLAVTGQADVEIAARKLLEKGVGAVVVTLGSHGSIIVTGDTVEAVPAMVVEAKDTTAAGDVFNGVMVAELAAGSNLKEAVKMGAAASAIAVTRWGAIAAIPTKAEVLEFIG